MRRTLHITFQCKSIDSPDKKTPHRALTVRRSLLCGTYDDGAMTKFNTAESTTHTYIQRTHSQQQNGD